MSNYHFTRRHFLELSGSFTFALALTAGCAQAAPTAETVTTGAITGAADKDAIAAIAAIAAMRAKWRASLIGSPSAAGLESITHNATEKRDTMNTTATRNALWADQTGSAGVTGTFSNLLAMALAYATPGQPLFGDEKLAAQTIDGLDWMVSHLYSPQTKPSGNWWDWEIGAPQKFTNAAILLYDKLSPARRAAYEASITHFIPDPTRRTASKNLRETGANLSDKSLAIALTALLTNDVARLTEARDALSPIFHYVTSGDGFYADGSFVQHGDIPYTGTYGVVLLNGLAHLFSLLGGTPWEVVDPHRKIIFDTVENSYAPFIFNGLMMDGVNGRAVSRGGSGDAGGGLWAMNSILLLAQGAPKSYAEDYAARVKGWKLRSGNGDQKLPSADVIVALPEPINHRLFANMDRAVHRRPGWALQISMCSTRIARYEGNINGENLHGWHTSDGMMYLYLDDDLGHFSADFWPTVDPYRLPGTTVDTLRLPPGKGGGRPQNARFVGGAVLNELYGAVAQDLEGFDSSLRAQKSWFCLDDAIVCLGAGINSSDNRPIETIIENRNLKTGEESWLVNGAPALEKAGSATIENVAFAHLEGVGGYLFPQKPTLKTIRETRSGTWKEIGGRTDDKVSRSYLTCWFDHGADPKDATYAYALLPHATSQQTAQRAQQPNFEILSNTAGVQAVRAGNLVLANFWTAGKLGDEIETFAPCSVILERKNGVLNVAVAHPSRTTSPVKIRIKGAAKQMVNADKTVKLLQSTPDVILEINNAESNGRTHSATLEL